MMMLKTRLSQRGNGGEYDEFWAAQAFIFLIIFSIFYSLGITLGLNYGTW